MAKEKILVVDDEQNVREIICELLKEEGYEPVEAKDSEEAEEKTKKEVIDLALIDLKMPGMNGLQLIQRIRKFNPDIQIVIITGYPSLESAREAIREEVYDYLTKPFSADELKSTVKKSLEKQQLVIANKKLMKELKEAKASLERRVKERTKELEESRNELVRDITKRKKLEEQINSLFEVSREIVSTLTIENTLNQIMNMSLVMLNGDAGSLMLIDEETKKLYIRAFSGLKEKFANVTLKIGERVAGWVVEHEEPLLIIDGFKNDSRFPHLKEREEIKSALCVPLKIKDTVIGVLNVNNLTSETNFTEKDLELLSTFANQAAVAIENAHLYEELITAKEYVDNIIKSMIDTLVVIDPDGSIKNVNQATLDLLGYKEDELIGQPAGVLFAEEEEEEEEEEELPFKGTRMKKLIEEGSLRDYEMTYKTKAGEKIPVSFSGSVMYETTSVIASPSPRHSERSEESQTLRINSAKQSQGIASVSPSDLPRNDTQDTDHGRRIVGIVGIARDMREIKQLMEKEKKIAAAAAAAAETEKKRAAELEKAYTDIEYSRDKLESIYRITKAVSSTLELERLLDLILQLTCKILKADGGSIMLFDENTKELVVKSAAGTAKDVVIGKRFKIGERFAGRSFQSGKPILVHDVEEEEWFKALPKYEVIKSGMSVPIEATKGKLIGVLNLKRTEREENFTHDDMELVSQFSRNIALAIDNALAYQFLSETKSYVENIIKSMVDTLIVTDAEGRIKTVNQATLDLLKYKEVEIIGQPAGVLFEEEEEEELFKESGFKKLLKSGFVKDVEVTYLTKDKRKIPVSLSGSVIRGKKGKLEGVVCVAHDLREMKEAQSQLVQAEKLSAIGRLAGSVAHEVKNPLGVILGNVQLLLRKEMDKGIREKLKVVERNVKAAAETTYNLMQFSREEKIEMAPLNLNPLIKKVVSDLKSIALQRNVKVKTLLLKDLPLIDGDKNSLNKLFLNLTLNAIESIKEKGEVKILSSKAKDFVKVSITDNGVGVASEDLDKVFEPFFSLKGKSKGVGLGLSMAQRIVETHQGRIEVESEVRKGSKFSVYLPIVHR